MIERRLEVVSKTFELQLCLYSFDLLKTCIDVGVSFAKQTYWLVPLTQPAFHLIAGKMVMFNWFLYFMRFVRFGNGIGIIE